MTDASSSSTLPAVPDSDPSRLVERLNLASGHCAVVGLQWGDEGKGKMIDILTRKYDLVARYNGGANAGHTVVVNTNEGEQKFALHLIPSGILYPDKVNVLGNGVVIDPEQLLTEVRGLTERGVRVDGDNLKISDRAHVVLPYHKLQDGLQEACISKARGDGQKIGTTGRGIGPCYADKAQRSTAIRVGELLQREHLAEKLRHVVAVKNLMLKPLADYAGETFEPIDAEALFERYAGFGEAMRPHVCDGTQLLHNAMRDGKQLLFEGANATLLDIDHGTYPFVTSSNCSSLGVPTGTGVPGHHIRHVIGIVKAYQTRVGGGPMPTELHDEIGQRIRDKGHEYGTTTGRPRRCGWLDLVALKYTAMVTGTTGIALMLFDVLAGLEELKVCVGYRRGDGSVSDHFPADAGELESVTPVYETLPGFSEDITECRSFEALPENARRYVAFVEEHIGVPIKTISVGPRRDQTLLR